MTINVEKNGAVWMVNHDQSYARNAMDGDSARALHWNMNGAMGWRQSAMKAPQVWAAAVMERVGTGTFQLCDAGLAMLDIVRAPRDRPACSKTSCMSPLGERWGPRCGI